MYYIQDLSSSKSFFTQLPNILFELDLTPMEFRFYCQLKKICGESGACWQSKVCIAKSMGITDRTVQDLKKSLSKPLEKLGNKPLIIITKRFNEQGDRDSDLIQLTDLWIDNAEHFINKSKNRGGENISPGVGKIFPQGGENISPKEEPFQEDLFKENNNNKLKNGKSEEEPPKVVVVSSDLKKKIEGLELSKTTLAIMQNYTEKEVEQALKCLDQYPDPASKDAFILSALRKEWKPKDTEEDLDKYLQENRKIAEKVSDDCRDACVYRRSFEKSKNSIPWPISFIAEKDELIVSQGLYMIIPISYRKKPEDFKNELKTHLKKLEQFSIKYEI